MFSSSVGGGSICLGCQLRAVTRRAAPVAAAAAQAQTRAWTGGRRRYASQATRSKPEDDLVAVLNEQRHRENSRRRRSVSASSATPEDDWDLPAEQRRKKSKPQDDFAAILNQQKHREDSHRRQSTSALETTPDDDLKPPDEQTHTTKPAHSRWGTPPPGAFEDEEYGAQEDGGRVRKVDGGRGFPAGGGPRHLREDDDESLAELAKFRSPATLKEPKANTYRKGNTKLVEDRPKLSVETLGREAEVIVLREGGDWHSRPYKEDERPADPGLTLGEYIDQEEGLSMDVIMDNIDELRPEHCILPAREFKAVFDQVMKGFTSYQLENYVERHHLRLEEGDESPFLGIIPDMSKPQPWILEQSVWTPEVQGAVEEVEHPLKGYILKSMKPKQRLVMQLMRECWGMSVQELMDGQGVLELLVRDLEFRLLTLGTQRWLQLISRVHLGQGGGKSIEVIKSRKAIRIMAPKVVAEACLKAMDETLQKIKTKTIQMEKVPMKRLNAAVFEELGRITNSIVKLNEARKEIEVTWIDSRDDPGSKLEDLADVVFRLLLTAYPPTRTERTLTVYPEVEGKGKFIEDISSKDKLPWMDRRIKWARLCLPLTPKEPRVAGSWPLDHSSVVKYEVRQEDDDLTLPTSTMPPKREAFYNSLAGVPLGFPRAPKEPQPEKQQAPTTKATPSGWRPFRVRTNAVFGHILHLNNPHVASSIHEGIEVLSSSSRTLNPLIPPIDEMDLPGWVPYKSPTTMTSVLLMRFAPYSSDPTRPQDPLAPHLELRIKATDDAIIEVDTLRAVAHTHVSDILLPAEHVDVRATQKLAAELPGDDISTTEGMQPLLQFLRDAKLEMAAGRLVTPPRLTDLGLPRWMFYRPEADAVSPFLGNAARAKLAGAIAATRTTTGDDDDQISPYAPAANGDRLPSYMDQRYSEPFNALRPVSYVFAGLELHRPLETTYDGWKLFYTSVEAGQGGGRRAELSLEAVPSDDWELRRDAGSVDTQRFLRSTYKLARGLDGNVVRRPRDGEEVRSRIAWVGKSNLG